MKTTTEEMTRAIDLQPFCSTDPSRPELAVPFRNGEWTYATDRRLIVRVPATAYPAEERENAPKKLESLGPWTDSDRAERGWRPMPELPVPLETACEDCKGTGKVPAMRECEECNGGGQAECNLGHLHTCEDCHGKGKIERKDGEPGVCEECDGSGKEIAMQKVDLGFADADERLLRKVAALPSAEIPATGDDPHAVIPFRFDGGMGLLMPLRRAT